MNGPLPIKIIGIGRYLPERVVTNPEVEHIAGLEPGSIDQSAAGVKTRRWVNGETATWMGAEAAKEALDDAGLTIRDIDLILNGSGSQEQAIPDGGPLIQRHLGVADSGIPCMSVHTTCLGFVSALNVAANFIATGQYRNILIYTAEIASCAINPKEHESFVLFGDGAAAVVVTHTPEGESSRMEKFLFKTYGEGAYTTCIMGGGTARHPNLPTTKPEDNLFHMDGWQIYKLARKYGIPALEELQPGLTKSLGDIRMAIPHQASGMAIRTYLHFGWPEDQVAVTVDRLGNCIAASIPITLYEVIRENRIQRGEKMLLVGTGAGLSIGAAILIY